MKQYKIALIEHVERAGIRLTKLLSGPNNGDDQIAAMCAEGKIDVVNFLGIT
jgi:methylglyoxal synthase